MIFKFLFLLWKVCNIRYVVFILWEIKAFIIVLIIIINKSWPVKTNILAQMT